MTINDLNCFLGGVLTGCALPEMAAKTFKEGARSGASAVYLKTDVDAKDVLARLCKTSPAVCMIPKILHDIVSPVMLQKF